MEEGDRSQAHRGGFLAMSGVEGGLPTAGLPLVESHFATASFKDLHRRHCGGRPELVDQATGKESDPHVLQNIRLSLIIGQETIFSPFRATYRYLVLDRLGWRVRTPEAVIWSPEQFL